MNRRCPRWSNFLYVIAISILTLFRCLSTTHGAEKSPSSNPEKLRVLIITGGHAFESEPFFKMFDEMPGISWTHVEFQHGAEEMLKPENAEKYDVSVFYDMHQNYETHYRNWMEVLKKGKPTVFLHHALGSYVNWEQYGEIVGGRANFGGQHVNWAPNTTFHHDIRFQVQIADPSHPITKGLHDFEIVDETYNHFAVNPDVHVLLKTDEPTSGKIIGWAHRYGNSPIVYLELGHGPTAYNDPNFRTILSRSIHWVAEQLGK